MKEQKFEEEKILKPPTNYSGSKDKIMTQLIEHFPSKDSVQTFYDVFAGGLSVSINTDYNKTVSNDILSPLIKFYDNLYKATKDDNIEEEIEKILSYKIDKTSPEQYASVREEFNKTFDPYLFFALVSSCTNNMMRFNQKFKFNQTFGKRTINDNTIKKIRDYSNVLRNKDITFTNYHFSNFFSIYKLTKEDFIYLDPPYYGITEAGYNNYWSKDSEKYLYDTLDILDKQGIRFALSGVSIHKGIENPFMNRLSKYKVVNIKHDYEKVARKKNMGESQEILVINY